MSHPPRGPGPTPPQWAATPQPDGERTLIIVLVVIGCLLLLAVGGCIVAGMHMAREVKQTTESMTKTMGPMMETSIQQQIDLTEKQIKAAPAGSAERIQLEEQLRSMRELRDSLRKSPIR